MRKSFNTTGVCIPELHYMVNIKNKLNIIEDMIDKGKYFVINRPRQYGKTTTMYLLEEELKDKYIIISMSFESFSERIFSDETIFCNKFIKKMINALKYVDKEKARILKNLQKDVEDLDDLSDIITEFIEQCNKEVILIIDEVDKSSNNQLFLSFLGILRDKYLLAKKKRDNTFKSVILAGVYDIKNLKIKILQGEELKLNSPWNIAVNFDLDMNFNIDEIKTIINEYAEENNLNMDNIKLAERLYFYTNGYPFLVSRLCQIIDEKIGLISKRPWNIEDIDMAVKEILKEGNTLFDDIVKNIENNEDIYKFIQGIILSGDEIPYIQSNLIISLCTVYGIIRDEEGKCKVNNRIFELFLYNHMTSKISLKNNEIQRYNFREAFINEDGSLKMELILLRFQQFMKEQYSHIDAEFIEREGRLLFLAFIKPIINGIGFDFKEVQISEEKRLDIVITYNNFKYIIELKIWNGPNYHKKGLKQLYEYLDTFSMNQGYLVIYNFNKSKEYKNEITQIKEKNIFSVYV